MNRDNADQNQNEPSPDLEDYGQAIARMEAQRRELEPGGRWPPERRNDLAEAYLNRGKAFACRHELSRAMEDYGQAIALMEALRRDLEPGGQWPPAWRNGLAGAYMNRGVAYRNRNEQSLAIKDYGLAIALMEALRRDLEPDGQWPPKWRNNLSVAYMNRGNAHRNQNELSLAIEDYGQAIAPMEALRRDQEPESRWPPAWRNGLSAAFLNRGNALADRNELLPAIDDYTQAIALWEGLRRELEPTGQWPPAWRNDLAAAYMNRGVAKSRRNQVALAVEDYGLAIAHMEALRGEMEPVGQWSPAWRKDLAGAYMNRGNAYRDQNEQSPALGDFSQVIALGESLRRVVEPTGQWSPSRRNDLAAAYMNRGNALAHWNELLPAIEDYTQAIALREGLRRELEPTGQWPPQWRNALAMAYVNRAMLHADIGDCAQALPDARMSMEIVGGLRRHHARTGATMPLPMDQVEALALQVLKDCGQAAPE